MRCKAVEGATQWDEGHWEAGAGRHCRLTWNLKLLAFHECVHIPCTASGMRDTGAQELRGRPLAGRVGTQNCNQSQKQSSAALRLPLYAHPS